jgi:hypothetical protein
MAVCRDRHRVTAKRFLMKVSRLLIWLDQKSGELSLKDVESVIVMLSVDPPSGPFD